MPITDTANNINARAGVLIIGSLLWDFRNGRKEWRDKHLKIRSRIAVNVPIRYGRKSTGDVYTLTFANSSRKHPGLGFVAAFRNNPTMTFDDLLKEAVALSRAEGMKGKFLEEGNQGLWGALGILFNNDRIDSAKQQIIQQWWEARLKAELELYPSFLQKKFRLGKEIPCILPNGKLNFPWITAVNVANEKRLNDFDFLIATATLATGKKYPTVSTMAENISHDIERYYFHNNHNHGIITHQDERILKRLV